VFLGVATWMVASIIIHHDRIERITAGLMITNYIVSMVRGLVTAWSLGWMLTTPGTVSYIGSNMLVLALSVFVLASFRRRQASNG